MRRDEFHAYSSRTGRSGGKSSAPQYGLGRSRQAIRKLIANSFAALIGTRAKFKRTTWGERGACTEPYQLCDTRASIKYDGAVIPALSKLFVFFT
jgi:hypothetical protein